MTEQSFRDAIEQTRQNIKRFEQIEGKPWGIEGAVIELAKQVGQLSALVMNREGYYYHDRDKADPKYKSSNAEIGDELVDIMFAVVRIADNYGIDLVESSQITRTTEDKFLKEKGV